MDIEEIEVIEDKTLIKLLDELKLSEPFLLEINGEVFYPDDNYSRLLRKGDTVKLIPILAGG